MQNRSSIDMAVTGRGVGLARQGCLVASLGDVPGPVGVLVADLIPRLCVDLRAAVMICWVASLLASNDGGPVVARRRAAVVTGVRLLRFAPRPVR